MFHKSCGLKTFLFMMGVTLTSGACGGQPAGTLEQSLEESTVGIAGETPETGCVSPGGWWKEHNRYAALPANQIAWPVDEDTSFCGQTVLHWVTAPLAKGDAWRALLGTVICAHLNDMRGAALPEPVRVALSRAKTLTGTCALPPGTELEAFSLMATLNQYCSGQAGVPRCP